ncbi:MAG: hypothetical protein AB8I08_26710, partial [Sandaracinaceae bacterium]
LVPVLVLPRRLFSFGVPVFAAFVACATFVPALFGMGGRPHPTDAVLFTGLTSLFLLAFLPLFRKRLGEAVFGTVGGILLGFSVGVLQGCTRAWSAPFVFGLWHCGNEDADLLLLSPLFVGLPVACFGWVGGWLSTRVGLRGWMTWVALGLFALQFVGTAAGLIGRVVTNAPYPSAEAWMADDRGQQLEFAVAEQTRTAVRDVGEGVRLERRCERVDNGREEAPDSLACRVRLRPAARVESCSEGRGCPGEGLARYGADDTLDVRRDAHTGMWLVSRAGERTMVFGSDLEPRDVSRADLRGVIRAPVSSKVLALLGLGLGLLFVGLWRRSCALSMQVRGGRAGSSDGLEVCFDDGMLPARVPLRAATAPGPVVVIGGRHEAAQGGGALVGYRDAGTMARTRVFEGQRDAVLRRLATRGAGFLILAYATLMVTGIPLLCM